MSQIKEDTMRVILDLHQRNRKNLSIDVISRHSGHTKEITRKWIKFFIEKGILVKVNKLIPFTVRLSDKVLCIDVTSFFVLYNGRMGV